jgi:hypothetical protein
VENLKDDEDEDFSKKKQASLSSKQKKKLKAKYSVSRPTGPNRHTWSHCLASRSCVIYSSGIQLRSGRAHCGAEEVSVDALLA